MVLTEACLQKIRLTCSTRENNGPLQWINLINWVLLYWMHVHVATCIANKNSVLPCCPQPVVAMEQSQRVSKRERLAFFIARCDLYFCSNFQNSTVSLHRLILTDLPLCLHVKYACTLMASHLSRPLQIVEVTHAHTSNVSLTVVYALLIDSHDSLSGSKSDYWKSVKWTQQKALLKDFFQLDSFPQNYMLGNR